MIKWQIIAWTVTGVFGAAITWIKFHGGKITAWLRVVSSVSKLLADMNDACADGKASPDEMQKLSNDYNQMLADLGLLKKGASK